VKAAVRTSTRGGRKKVPREISKNDLLLGIAKVGGKDISIEGEKKSWKKRKGGKMNYEGCQKKAG